MDAGRMSRTLPAMSVRSYLELLQYLRLTIVALSALENVGNLAGSFAVADAAVKRYAGARARVVTVPARTTRRVGGGRSHGTKCKRERKHERQDCEGLTHNITSFQT